jgi:hypothetical protein
MRSPPRRTSRVPGSSSRSANRSCSSAPTEVRRRSAGDELLEGERLRHVVVGARIEPSDTVFDLIARREHQHRYTVTAAADPTADLEPVDHGHQDVEDDRIRLAVAVRLEALERLLAVGSQLDLVALELEGPAEGLTHGPFVVHDQNLHSTIVVAEAERRLRRAA